MRKAWLFFIVLFWAASSLAQDFPMLHYTFEDGLPSNTVYQIYRDSKGFLWIGTDKGIARYNGIKFEVFTTYNGLPDNEIYFFKEDSHGRLWLAAANGKLCFFKNDTFYTEKNTPFLVLPFTKSHINNIQEEYDSSITVSYYDPVIMVSIKKDTLYNYDLKRIKTTSTTFNYFYKRKTSPSTFHIYDRSADIYIDTNFHILKRIEKKYDPTLKISFSQNQQYIYSQTAIFDTAFNVLRVRPYNSNQEIITHNIYTDGQQYFECTHKGLYVNDTLCILQGLDVSSVTQDNIGNYWVGTLNAGIYCLRRDFQNGKLFNNAYSGNMHYAKKLKEYLFFNTTSHLYMLKNKSIKELIDLRQYSSKGYFVPNTPVAYLDNDFSYYYFHNNYNLVIDNILSKEFAPNIYYHPLIFLGLKTMVKDVNDRFIIRAIVDVLSIDYKNVRNGDTINYKFIVDTLLREKTYCNAQDGNNEIWYSTVNSIYKIRNGESIIQTQLKNIALKNFIFLGENMVGNTFDNKLLFISNPGSVPRVDTIASENCVWNKLYKLNDSILLISTNNLDRILTIHSNNSKKKYSLSVLEDPFVPLNIESICSDDSNCYFFKEGSITVMSISSLLRKSMPPKLFFSLFKTGKKQYSIAREIEVAYNESRNISVSFSAHSFSGKNISYLYSVSKNGEDNWRPTKSEEINLVNPTYGSYNIKVRAKTMNSDYSAPIVFTFHILRPYWATWWFVSLCVFLAILLAGVIIRIRIRYVVKKNKKKHEQDIKFVKSEYKALNALMNPHFIFNTLNNVQGLFNANDKLAANEYLRIFADLIRQNMHNVSKELIPLQREIALVMNYLMLEKLRFEDKLNYIINVEDNIDTSEFMVPPLLIQPLVENSIKHGILPMKELGGTVIVSVFEADYMLCIEVKDNGVGINHTKKESGIMHESFGMENIKKRIEQLSIIQGKEITFDIREINDEADNHLWTISTIRMHV